MSKFDRKAFIEELGGLGEGLLRRDFPFSLWSVPPLVTGFVVLGFMLCIFIAGNAWLAVYVPQSISQAGHMHFPYLNWEEIVLIILIAYVVTMNEILRERFIDDYLALRPALKASVENRRRILAPFILHRHRNRALTSAFLVAVSLPFLMDVFQSAPDHPLGLASLVLRVVLLMWVIGASLYDSFDSRRRMSFLVREGFHVDLFNTEPLRAFARSGIQISATIAIGCAIGALLLTEKSAIIETAVLLFINLGVAFSVLYFPARIVRTEIAKAKENTGEELDRLIGKLWGDALGADQQLAHRARIEIGGLMAMRQRVDDVSEWLFGAPTIARVVVFGLLPIASWVAAALVEGLVQRLFG